MVGIGPNQGRPFERPRTMAWPIMCASLSGSGNRPFRTDSRDTAVFSDFWLIKTDSNGNELWSHAYGNRVLLMIDGGLPTSDVAYSVQETADGGFVVAGSLFWNGRLRHKAVCASCACPVHPVRSLP